MMNVLAARNRALLQQFAWSRVLLAFDYDGTLAPIVNRPDAARMRTRTQALLETVAERYPCAVISGRARADTRRRVRGVRLVEVVGNHGLEPGSDPRRAAAVAGHWAARLEHELRGLRGVVVEDKGPSVAVHYRRARVKRAARRAIAAAIRGLGPGVRSLPGKLVVNVLPVGAPHKGLALQRLRARVGADTAIYVGDDGTDEDVFSLDEPGRLLSIRVGPSARSAAPYYVRNQAEVDRLLAALASLRAPAAAGAGVRG